MFENTYLLGDIKRLSQWVSEWPMQVNGARWFNFFSIGSGDRYPYRWDAVSFNFPLNQSYGLVANTSSRRQENSIHMVIYKTDSNFRCTFLD